MSYPRSWTDAQFLTAVATCTTQRAIITALGLRVTGGAHTTIHRHAQRLGVTLPNGQSPGRPRGWTDEQFREAVLGPPPARILDEVTERLGLSKSGQTNRVLRRRAAEIGLTLPDGWSWQRREAS